MRRVAVVPGEASASVRDLLRSAGWEAKAAGPPDGQLEHALAVGAEGRWTLFVSSHAQVSPSLRRVLVLHDGTASAEPGMTAADEAAVASGAEIVVLHVPGVEPPGDVASLPAPRIVDQEHYEWREWRREFVRRFCRPSKGVSVRVEVAVGPLQQTVAERARQLGADVMAAAWQGEPDPGRAENLKEVARAAPCPVLLVGPRAALPLDRLDAVIFDMDGVLTDTASLHADSWKRLFDEYLRERALSTGEQFVEFDKDQDYRAFVDGKPRLDGVRDFLASRGISIPEAAESGPSPAETIEGLGKRKNAYFMAALGEHGARPYRTTVEVVRALKARGLPTAIVSASRHVTEVLEAGGLRDLFDVQVDGVDAARLGLEGKPDPAVFLEAARQLHVQPERAAVVEDAIAGVEAGRRGGFGLVIGVDRRGRPDALRAAGADIVVDDLGSLQLEPPASRQE